MSRNAESRFAINPTNIDIQRSKFSRHSSLKTSFNVGDIVPIYIDEVLPGDTFEVKTNFVARLQTLITPVMDNIYLDTYYFFVPNRLVWEHWKEFNGENTQSAWLPSTQYEVPQIVAPESGWNVGTIADYFGIPTGVGGLSVNALPFRAYALIMNEWFRDENLSDPLNIPVDETTVTGVNTGVFVTDVAKGGLPYKAAKYHDYFTSALPAPQKGPDVSIDMTGAGTFPVWGNGNVLGFMGSTDNSSATQSGNINAFGAISGFTSANNLNGAFYSGLGVPAGAYNTGSSVQRMQRAGVLSKEVAEAQGFPSSYTGLEVDLSSFTIMTINQLRMAFQIQKLYERDARGGTRYIEILKSHFGVTSPDARLQRPEYLGGQRTPLSINQVIQTSATDTTSPQGNTAAMSLTTDSHHDFKRSFTEHGFVIGLAVARYDHTYQQGLERFWRRKDRFDYYWPVFANIGEQAILNSEIYAQGTDEDDEVFGYQEAWADYRYKPSRVSGEMRSQYQTSLDAWHLADDYDALPALSDAWIREDKSNVDRVLAVSSAVSNQLFADFFIQNWATRPMPMYSIPGLMDHH